MGGSEQSDVTCHSLFTPRACIECSACEPACPVEAIYAEFDLPAQWATYVDIDALWYRDQEAARAVVDTVHARA